MSQFSIEKQGHNSFLVYKLEGHEEIDTLSSGMLTNNKINGLAPYSYSVLDEVRYFKFNITSKVPMNRFLSGNVARERLIGVLHSMMKTLISLDDYMLVSESVIIDKEQIYVDISTNQAWLVYLPLLLPQQNEQNIGTFVRELMMSIQFDPSENGDYIARIMNYINANTEFSVLSFSKLLEELVATKGHKVVPAMVPLSSSSASAKTSQSTPTQVQSTHSQTPPSPAKPVSSSSLTKSDVGKKEKKTEKKEVPMVSQALAKQGETTPANFGFSIPGVSQGQSPSVPVQKPIKADKKPGLFSSLFSKKSKNDKEAPMPIQSQAENHQNNIKQMAYVAQAPQPNTPLPTTSNPVTPQVKQVTQMNHAGGQVGETTVLGLGNGGETTVLGAPSGQNIKPYLVRLKNNQRQFIDKTVFKIGKDQSYVDFYIADNTAISRTHADIITENGEYYIYDNNSTNHTYLDDTMIGGEQKIKIVHGSKIKLANEEFEFRLY